MHRPHPTTQPAHVAAVLVNYFGAPDIAQAARSVLADAPEAEVLVVDNSADTAEHQRLGALLPAGARLIDAGANLGFGRACNLAWASTAAPFVFFVNPDVQLVGGGCTAALVQALQADPGLAAVSPRQFLDNRCQWYMPPAGLPTAVRAWAHERALRESDIWQRLGRAARAENLRLWTAREPIPQRALSGGALLLRRAALAPEGLPFDPQFFMYYEDSDLCLRLRQAGWRLAVVPAARAVHTWRNQPHKHALMHAGGRVYFGKHYARGPGLAWLERADAVAVTPPGMFPGCVLETPWVDVPPAWQAGWLLELSPSPLLQPAIGLIAAGSKARIPAAVSESFCTSPLYGRLSALTDNGNLRAEALVMRWRAGPMPSPA